MISWNVFVCFNFWFGFFVLAGAHSILCDGQWGFCKTCSLTESKLSHKTMNFHVYYPATTQNQKYDSLKIESLDNLQDHNCMQDHLKWTRRSGLLGQNGVWNKLLTVLNIHKPALLLKCRILTFCGVFFFKEHVYSVPSVIQHFKVQSTS